MDNRYILDLSIIPKELILLLEIMKIENVDVDSIECLNVELLEDIDWDFFLKITNHHRIYPIVYSKLKQIDKKIIPSHVIQALYLEYKRNTYEMLKLSGEMEQVSKLFNENQIRLLFLKGPIIAFEIYGDVSLRTSKDLDILIQKNDLKRAEELLLNQGYKREEVSATLYEWKWNRHHVSYFHPQKRIEVEIHWRLHPAPAKEPSFNELWKRKRISLLTSYPTYFLGNEDLLLFLFDHGARHGWFRLRWLADIDQLIRKEALTKKNSELLKKFQQNYIARQALILSSQLLNTPINEKMRLLTAQKRSKKLAQLAIFYIIEMGHLHIKEPEDILPNHKNQPFSIKTNLHKSFVLNFYQFSIKSNLQKVIFVMKLLYPTSADVKTLRLPNAIHFLYFPLRPLLWIWRKIRRPEQ